MTITKFGKKSSDVLSIKKNFYTDNDFLLSKQKKYQKFILGSHTEKNVKLVIELLQEAPLKITILFTLNVSIAVI